MPRWVPKTAIRALHAELLAEHGGLSGGVKEDLLEATLARPQHLDAYGNPAPSLFDLAASYGFGFAKNHCFVDGNKRVALMAIYIFLDMNGYELSAPEKETVMVIERLAAGEITESALSNWIRENSVPIRE